MQIIIFETLLKENMFFQISFLSAKKIQRETKVYKFDASLGSVESGVSPVMLYFGKILGLAVCQNFRL